MWRSLLALGACVVAASACRTTTTTTTTTTPLDVHVRQVWSDLEIRVRWPDDDWLNGQIENQTLAILLRVGSRFPRQSAVPALGLEAPDWPFDLALTIDVPQASLSDEGGCMGCRVWVSSFEGTWTHRAVPAGTNATAFRVDDNALGLPRAPTAIEWCARRSGCEACESTGMFAFDPRLRWQSGSVVLAGSHRHYCSVLESHALRCWGWNGFGQLGLGHTRSIGDDEFWKDQPPVVVGASDRVESVAVGWAHSCALTELGGVWCWGLNAHGQLGFAGPLAIETPSQEATITSGAVAVVAGGNHSCALFANGSLACWGANAEGQLGLGDTGDRFAPTTIPGLSVARVAAGWHHTCAVTLAEHAVVCWGANEHGQLGVGDTQARGDDEAVAALSPLSLALPVVSVSCGATHTCVTTANQTSLCWGGNAEGQLGRATTEPLGDDEPLPTEPLSIGDAAFHTAAFPHHTCALLERQWLKCWGSDLEGQLGLCRFEALGDDEALDHIPPVEAGGDVAAVAGGSSSTCIVRHWGAVECWGIGAAGEVGATGPATHRPCAIDAARVEVPTALSVGTLPPLRRNSAASIRDLACGETVTCAVFSDGSVRCWGGDGFTGLLGLGINAPVLGDDDLPSSVAAIALGGPARTVACGSIHVCAGLEDGRVRCWGQNSFGQLGLGHNIAVGDPSGVAPVSLPGSATQLACGAFHVCVVLTEGAVQCWGRNEQGQLGLSHRNDVGDNELPSSQPTASIGGRATLLAAGAGHTCAVLSEGGAVRCWGGNEVAQLGLGHTNSLAPTDVPTDLLPLSLGGAAVSLTCGARHTCVVLRGGAVRCWGANDRGQLGLAHTRAVTNTPANTRPVSLQGPAASVASFGAHTCAVLAGGSVQCWGLNEQGQLGLPHADDIGDNEHPSSTALLTFDSAVLQVAPGDAHTCATLTGGALRCWGSNQWGQLGLAVADSRTGLSTVRTGRETGHVRLHRPATQLSTFDSHTCALLSEGRVQCWGSNLNGQLGLGHTNHVGDDELPISAALVSLDATGSPDDAAAISVACGHVHSCALLASGAVRCWGSNADGQLGLRHTNTIGDDELPSTAPPISLGGAASSIACGRAHSCVVMHEDGAVRCWGLNDEGQLGLAHIFTIGDDEHPSDAAPVQLGGLAQRVACGAAFTCALMQGGEVRCWGRNVDGNLGLSRTDRIGNNEHPSSVDPVALGQPVIALDCGSQHTCAVLLDGSVRCWGANTAGQLGLGHTLLIGNDEHPGDEPAITFGQRVLDVACGVSHSCAILANHTFSCWGANAEGQLGLLRGATLGAETLPSPPVSLASPIEAMTSGERHSCALQANQAVVCWGSNQLGQLGLSASGALLGTGPELLGTPAVLSARVGARVCTTPACAAAGRDHTCSIVASGGGVRCWGGNGHGQLGLGAFVLALGDDELPLTKDEVTLGSAVAQVAASGSHTCVLLNSGGSVFCWGRNDAGQLGLGHTMLTDLPPAQAVALSGASTFIACGGAHSCAVLVDGSLQCWGGNTHGQLGLGHVDTIGDNEPVSSTTPLVFASAVTSVAGGEAHTCAILSDQSVHCWGHNHKGQLGAGNTDTIGDNESPTATAAVPLGGRSATSVACGAAHTCVLLGNDGGVWCWGWNADGQLGLGHTLDVGDDESLSASVASVGLGDAVLSVACGARHTCVTGSTGQVQCWGSNSMGQLGLGDTRSRLRPAPVPLVRGVADAVVCGAEHSCAALEGGFLQCWGGNAAGQLGLGTSSDVGSVTLDATTVPIRDAMMLLAQASSRGSVRPMDTQTLGLNIRVHDSRTTMLRLGGAGLTFTPDAVDTTDAPNTRALPSLLLDSMVFPQQVASAPLLRDESMCATKTVATQGLCVVDAAQPWLETEPTASIQSVHTSEPDDVLLPRGGTRVTVAFSSSWLSLDVPLAIAIDGAPCTNLSYPSPSTVQCLASAGRGTNNSLTSFTPSLLLPPHLTSPETLTFAPPVIDLVLPNENVSPFGAQLVRIDGANFGVPHPTDQIAFGEMGCDVETWADTLILCRSRPTPILQSSLHLVLGGQTAQFPVTFNAPKILTVLPSVVFPSNDSSRVTFTVVGSGFGAEVNGSLSVSVGGIPCPAASLVSFTRLECRDLLIPTAWTSTAAEAGFGVVTAAQPDAFRWLPPPFIDTVLASAFPTTGGPLLRIRGGGFGVAHDDIDFVQVGDEVFRAGITRVSEFELTLPLPAGVGEGVLVRVGLVRNLVTPAASFSYDRPIITTVTPPTVLSGATHVNLTLCGSNLGTQDSQLGRASVSGLACPVLRALNASCALCVEVPGPFTWPSSRDASIDVGGQRSLPALGVFDVTVVPNITAASFVSLSTTGGDRVRLIGEGFDDRAGLVVTIGATEAPIEEVVSAFEVRVRAPPGVGRMPVVVRRLDGLQSPPFFLAYDRPTVRTVEPSYVLVGPRPRSLVFHGSNFGADPHTPRRIFVGGVPCPSVHVWNDSALRCDGLSLAEDQPWPEPNTVVVEVASLASEPVRGVLQTLARAVVEEVLPSAVFPGLDVTVSGSNFGLARDDLANVTIGGHPCARAVWLSSERIRCTIPVDHPMFLAESRPENTSDTSLWFAVQVTTAAGALSAEGANAELGGARLAPASWMTGSPPRAVPRDVAGAREVGRAQDIHVTWWIDDVTTLDEASPSLQVTGFLLLGRASDGSEFRSQHALGSVDRQSDGSARARFTAPLFVSSPLPIEVRVVALNAFGEGPPSNAYTPVFERCDERHFLATHREPAQWQCVLCPVEAVCGGLNAENVTARRGFWRVPWSRDRLGFRACPVEDACRGWDGGSFDALRALTNSSDPFIAVPGLRLHPTELEGCAAGYRGVLCAACEESYYQSSSGECLLCGSQEWVALRAAGLLLLVIFILAVILLRAYKSAGEGSSNAVRTAKIVFNHFQTIALISAIQFQWPSAVSGTFAVSNSASSFGIEGVSLECVMGETGYSPLGKSLVSLSIPVWLLLFAAVFWFFEGITGWKRMPALCPCCPRWLSDALHSGSTKNVLDLTSFSDRWLRRMKVSIPVLIFLAHMSVTRAAFQLVTCTPISPADDPAVAQYRLAMDLDTRCDDPANLLWMIGTAVPVIVLFSFGVPCATIAFLFNHRSDLESNPEHRRLYSFLYAGYDNKYNYWEGVNLLRKVLLTFVTVILAPFGAFNQVGAGLLVIVGFQAAHSWLKPFDNEDFNKLELTSLLVSITSMIAGLFIQGSESTAVALYVAPIAIYIGNGGFLALISWKLCGEFKDFTGEVVKRRISRVSSATSRPSMTPAAAGAIVLRHGERDTFQQANPLAERNAHLPTKAATGSPPPPPARPPRLGPARPSTEDTDTALPVAATAAAASAAASPTASSAVREVALTTPVSV